LPSVRSAAIGIWVNVGSRDESANTRGASHFLEHLLFKGTQKRDALAISASIEAVGGELNAFTSKEYTCFYARVLDQDFPLAVDVLGDLITSSKVKKVDVDAERSVVLEEISMRDDDPSDLIHDLFLQIYYGDSDLGLPILGSVESITNINRSAVFNYYKRKYHPADIVVAVAGNVEHKAVVRLVKKALSANNFLDVGKNSPRLRVAKELAPVGLGKAKIHFQKTEQAHLLLGVPGVARNDDRRFALSVLASALGGGMSSRLFQEIREKRGLAYSVYSYVQQFAGAGSLAFYAGCAPAKAEEVIGLIRQVGAEVARDGLSAEELARAKGSVCGALVLSQEDTGSQMSRIGKSELVYGEVASFDEILGQINAVTAKQVQDLAKELLLTPATLAIVGPFKDSTHLKKFEALIK
jgi:predicted Zn-dependent peptidase